MAITKIIVISLNEEDPYSIEWFRLGFAEPKPEGNNQNETLKSKKGEKYLQVKKG